MSIFDTAYRNLIAELERNDRLGDERVIARPPSGSNTGFVPDARIPSYLPVTPTARPIIPIINVEERNENERTISGDKVFNYVKTQPSAPLVPANISPVSGGATLDAQSAVMGSGAFISGGNSTSPLIGLAIGSALLIAFITRK